MQTQPATTTPVAAIAAQAASPADGADAQVTESFGNVLARQRAQATQDGSRPQESKPATKPSAADGQTAEDAATVLPATSPTVTGPLLPGDALAALLPAAASGTDAQGDTQLQATEKTDTLPDDMLAMLTPAATAAASAASLVADPAANAKKSAPEILEDQNKEEAIPALPTMPTGLGATSRATTPDSAATSLVANARKENPTQTLPVSAHGKEAAKVEIAAGKEKTFSVELERLGRENEMAQATGSAAGKISAQAVDPTAADTVNTLAAGMAAPAPAAQNVAAQAAQAVINTPVTHETWGEEFGQKITWMATQHEQTAELHLNPPNLGPLDVVLNVSGDQATALFTSPHAAVRDAVEQALPRLRDMLADSGITLGNAMVSDQSAGEHQAWQAEQQKGEGRSGNLDGTTAEAAPLRVASIRHHQGLVDTFA